MRTIIIFLFVLPVVVIVELSYFAFVYLFVCFFTVLPPFFAGLLL